MDLDPIPSPPGRPACEGTDPRLFTDGDLFSDPRVAMEALAMCRVCPVVSWCAQVMSGYTSGDVIVAGTIFRHGRATTVQQLAEAREKSLRSRRRRRVA